MTNDILFYGGLITAGVAATIGVIYSIVIVFISFNLQRKLDEEYGSKIR